MGNELFDLARKHTASMGLFVFFSFVAGASAGQNQQYEEAVKKWSSHEDVAAWLKSNFVFDTQRQQQVQMVLKEKGPAEVPTRKAENLFIQKSGYCRDSASFAKDALNKIDAKYNARYLFIRNGAGNTNHWVTGFTVNNKIFVIDFGAGPHWSAMNGVHGPYDSLDEYKAFLSSLAIKRFTPQAVFWRDIPGQED